MTTKTFNPYAGAYLTAGSFVELHRRNAQLITACGAEKLRVTEQLPRYTGLLDQLSLRLNMARGFAETPEVKRLDQERDATQKFIYFSIIYASELPRTSSLYAAANELRVVTTPYKSIAHHELTRQTTETAGFIRDLKAHPEALAALGLTATVGELEQINNALAEEMGMRELTIGDRSTQRGDASTDSLRKQVTALLEEMALRINAAAVYLTDDAAIPKLISDLNGVADHYRQIAGQKSGTQGTEGTENPGTTTEPGTTDPGTTTDPTTPGGGGGTTTDPTTPGGGSSDSDGGGSDSGGGSSDPDPDAGDGME